MIVRPGGRLVGSKAPIVGCPPDAANTRGRALTDRRALPPRGTAILLALVAALLLLRLGATPLLGPDEPRYARVAVEMHRSGDHVTPTLQGRPWLEKPPLYYWLASAAFTVLGETEAAARLPSVAAGLLFVGATALVGARLYGGAAGLHAGFALGTSVLAFAYARAAAMDMLVAATITAAVGLIGLRLVGIAGGLAIPAAYMLMGLATLAKGPIGFLLPGLVGAGYVLATREWGLLRRLISPPGLLLFLLVAGTWYVRVHQAQGQLFVDVFLLDHNVQRFTSTIHHHPGPWHYYVGIVLLGLFPWSGLLVPAFAGLRARGSRADLYLLLWFLLPFAFFTAAASKLPGYILPCLPPLAILMGRAARDLTRDGAAGGHRAVAFVTVALAIPVGVAPFVLKRMGEPMWATTLPLAAWMLLAALAFAVRIGVDPTDAFRLLRIVGAGFLLLLTGVAPELLARRESGRDLFLGAGGREVLAWGASRTAWMAGYFYNDGQVREVGGLVDVAAAAARAPALVIVGPAEREALARTPSLVMRVLADGPRGSTLVRVVARPQP
jgi:4-amino-4-deoxy-L-arabinose transferase-like glycosyltransferase